MSADIKGVVSPVITPLDEDGTLAADRIPKSVEFTLECGCHAVVASGTGVQETSMLTPGERKTVVSETVAAVDNRVPILAGVSYPAQSVVSELVEHAESVGVDALLAMPPWGVEPSRDAIVRYYEAIAAETSLPILAYNNPSVTVDMTKETMLRVTKIDGVEYAKESSRDWQKLGWLLERIHHEGHADVLSTMDVFLPTLQTGGTGIITPAPLTVPSMEIYDAFKDGDIERAVEAQRTFSAFPPESVDTGLIGVCKAATELAGVDVGPPRAPYERVGNDGREAIDGWLDDVGVPRL